MDRTAACERVVRMGRKGPLFHCLFSQRSRPATGRIDSPRGSSRHLDRRPPSLSTLDQLVALLQSRALEPSTVKGYLTGARDYIAFCRRHALPLDPTPSTLARYVAYTSQYIASAPKYLVVGTPFPRRYLSRV